MKILHAVLCTLALGLLLPATASAKVTSSTAKTASARYKAHHRKHHKHHHHHRAKTF